MSFVEEKCRKCVHFGVCKYVEKIKESGLGNIMGSCIYFTPKEEEKTEEG